MKTAYNQAATSRQLTTQAGKQLIANLRAETPERLYLPGLDVNQDTPVEVLHVVLLGITKYFWRDAVSRQGSANRDILIARLNSFDVRGLGMPTLRGKSLVQYAKSLTGSNFRDILQVAPAVLYDLLEPRIYAMWVALCQLAPLVFQPEIYDIDEYLHQLEIRIDRLLLATVMSNPQWFNKPKFHVLLHLPGHVRRFGPPILFATETFESYNFVIRLRSIHSNRQSPSADIGAAFSLMHAIRHLVCGGYFQLPADNLMSGSDSTSSTPWIQAGPQVLAFLHDEVFLKFMGMTFLSKHKQTGLCRVNGAWDNASIAWVNTRAYRLCDDSTVPYAHDLTNCKSVRLEDGCDAELDGFIVISQQAHDPEQYSLGRISEILADQTSRNVLYVVVQPYRIGPSIEPYHFPSLLRCDRPEFVVKLEHIVATASAFHNCATHQCASSNTKPVRQERQIISTFEAEIQHKSRPDDLILNLAQLRSAQAIRYLYSLLTPPYPSIEEAIKNGIEYQKALERARQAAQEGKEAAKAERKAKQAERAEKRARQM
ncbi:hypothetical protein FRC11_009607 [Ceratobasidium sp. 423]|nr:hypothetical protein FRC11_009607 [Ceratobasidium sp. 423]